jgi:type II secretory pathway component PulF
MSGKSLVSNDVEAESVAAAKIILEAQKLKIISIQKQSKFSLLGSQKVSLKKTLPKSFIVYFCDTLSTCLNSGLTIIDVVRLILDQDNKPYIKETMIEILKDLKEGNSLSSAIENTGKFDAILISVVRSGEESGTLEKALDNIIIFYQSQSQLKSSILQAAIYPLILLIGMVGMVLFLAVGVIPTLKGMLDMDKAPLITKIYLTALTWVGNNPATLIGSLVGLVIGVFYLFKLPVTKAFMQKYIVTKAPFKGIVKAAYEARFIDFLYLQIIAGIPIPLALEKVKNVINNSYIDAEFNTARIEVLRGSSLSLVFKESVFLSKITIRMLAIADESGSLESVLLKLKIKCNKDFNDKMKRLVALVEPISTVVICLVVGSAVVAIGLPLMTMSSSLK